MLVKQRGYLGPQMKPFVDGVESVETRNQCKVS